MRYVHEATLQLTVLQTDIASQPETSALAKRINIPEKVGEVTTFTMSSQGQWFTEELTRRQSSPAEYVARMHASGTTFTVTASQMSEDPNKVVQTMVAGHYTTEKTATMYADPSQVAYMTSLSFKARTPAAEATASPTEDEKHQRDVDEAMDTMTILDEQPGHTTLNPDVDDPWTGVTVIDDAGTKYNVWRTTDDYGQLSLWTEGWEETHPTETVTAKTKVKVKTTQTQTETIRVTLVAEDKDTSIKPKKNGHKPAKAHLLGPQKSSSSPAPTIEAPIPKVEFPSASNAVPNEQTTTQNGVVTKIVTVTHTQYGFGVGHPGATLAPAANDPKKLAVGNERIMRMNIDELKRRHPRADWHGSIERLAETYRERDPSITEEDGLKYAFIFLYPRADPRPHVPQPSDDEDRVTQFFANIHGSTVPITAPVQTIGGQRYALDPLMKYKMYDHNTYNVVPTGSCHHSHGDSDDDDDDFNWKFWQDDDKPHDNHSPSLERHEYDPKECAVELCMFSYMRPIEITTAAPFAMQDSNGQVIYDWFTHKTSLTDKHWGTRDERGVYYPMTTSTTYVNGTGVPIPARRLPYIPKHEHASGLDAGVHGKPACHDVETCHNFCVHHAHVDDDGMTWWRWALVASAPFIISILALACCYKAFQRRRQRKQSQEPPRRKTSLAEKLGRKPTEKPTDVVVVNSVTGQATDPAGNPVDPATAQSARVAAGPAAGAQAAQAQQQQQPSEASADDGRGTMGRRAEEGRGRVNFADQGQGNKPADSTTAGNEQGQAEPQSQSQSQGAKPSGETSTQPQSQQAQAQGQQGTAGELHSEPQYVDPQPVPDKDGAAERRDSALGASGRDAASTGGSVRGRKRNRPEGMQGLPF